MTAAIIAILLAVAVIAADPFQITAAWGVAACVLIGWALAELVAESLRR